MTTLVARGAALKRPRTSMVTEEASASPVWGDEPSILARLREWTAQHPLRPDGGGPPELCSSEDIPIPWTRPASPDDRHQLPFLARHPDDVESAAAEGVLTALAQAATTEDDVSLERAREQLYAATLDTRSFTLCKTVERLLAERTRRQPIVGLGRWLLHMARHGEAIRLGLILVGLARDRSSAEAVSILARHIQFHRLATWQLERFGEDTVDLKWAWFASADCGYPHEETDRLMEAWGPELGGRPAVRRWVLITASYGVAARAHAGDLAGALAAHDIDDDLLDAACEIVWSLLQSDDRWRGIEYYPDGVLAVDRLIGHLLDRADSMLRLSTVQRVLAWLDWPTDVSLPPKLLHQTRPPLDEAEVACERRAVLGWTPDVRASLADDCARILRKASAQQIVRTAFNLESDPPRKTLWARAAAWDVAPSVGLDLWEEGFQRLQRSPYDSFLYDCLLETDDPERAERVLALAASLLPRATASGAFRQSSRSGECSGLTIALSLVRAMRRLGLYHERVVAFVLAQNECMVRDEALALLEDRDPTTWGQEVVEMLGIAAAVERCEHTRVPLARLNASRMG